MVNSNGYSLANPTQVKEDVTKFFKEERGCGFGNARGVRTLFETVLGRVALRFHKERLPEPTLDALRTIELEDIREAFVEFRNMKG